MTYPVKFRQKVFAVKEKHALTFQQVSQRFNIPIRSLFRWNKQLEPQKTRNKPASKIDMDVLAQHVQEHPDCYLWERAEQFAVTPQTIFYALKRLGVSVKKNSQTSQSQRRSTYLL